MPRPRSFDEDAVLERAMEVFWTDGYAGTSITRLERATGVARKSLYNTFGDKAALFGRALERFQAGVAERNLAKLEAVGAGRPAIEATLTDLAAFADTALGRRGCLACNTAREPVMRVRSVKRSVDQYFARVRAGFRDALLNARTHGEIDAHADVDVLADYLLGSLIAVCVMLRSSAGKAAIVNFARTATRCLDHPPATPDA